MRLTGRLDAYDVGEPISQGGFAIVRRGVAVKDPALIVAIKMPLPELPQELRNMFLAEAHAAAKVAGPFVVPVVDWGDAPPFIAFKYISDPTLAQTLDSRRRRQEFWRESELTARFLELARALQAINAHVIHRDIKPQNIFDCVDMLRVSDFGIAKYVDQATRSQTFKGAGTPQYMAPETLTAGTSSVHSDQYSLGVVFYEMAMLSPPFVGATEEVEYGHLYVVPPRISSGPQRYSQGLASVVARMLEKAPDNRFHAWSEVIKSLEASSGDTSQLTGLQSTGSADELARKAAAQLDALKSANLDRKRVEDALARTMRVQQGLLNYWVDRLYHSSLVAVNSVNGVLNHAALRISPPPGTDQPGSKRFSITFLDKSIVFVLDSLPPDSIPELSLWGYGLLLTNNRVWGTNFLVTRLPEPYGLIKSVDLSLNPLVIDNGRASFEGAGARYERLGQQFAVAINAEAILAQWGLRRTMSLLQWQEQDLDFDKELHSVLTVLIEDAAVPPRELKSRVRRSRWDQV